MYVLTEMFKQKGINADLEMLPLDEISERKDLVRTGFVHGQGRLD